MKNKIWLYAFLALSFGTQWCTNETINDKDAHKDITFWVNKTNNQVAVCLKNRENLDENTNALNALLHAYAPPDELVEIINKHTKLVFTKSSDYGFADNDFDATKHYDSFEKFGSFKEIPNIIFKSEQIKRVINAAVLENYRKKNNLDTLGIAQKYVHTVSYKDETRYVVLAKKVEHIIVKDGLSLPLKTAQHLVDIAEYSGFTDWGIWNKKLNRSKNIVYNADGKLVFIDTGDESFKYGKFFLKTDISSTNKLLVCECLYSCFKEAFDEEAKLWLENRIKNYENKEL